MAANNMPAPASVEAEEAVLGSILINAEAMAMVSGILLPTDFFLLKHNWIFAAMQALYDRNEDIDNVTVIEELSRARRLEEIGGSVAITKLINRTPTHVHAETYAHIVEHAAIKRKMLTALGEIAQSIYAENIPLTALIQQAHDRLTESSKFKHGSTWKFISEFASAIYDKTEQRYNHQGEPLGIPTGLSVLDAELAGGGWGRGEVILIAGRPGMGKSALGMGSAVAAARLGQHVAVVSKEMTGEELTFRVLAGESGINSEKIKRANLDDAEWSRFTESTGRTSELSIVMDDGVGTGIGQLKTECRRLHREWGIDILFVDYLQLLTAEQEKGNRNNEVDIIGRGLKELALEFKIPVVALSQLSRKVEERADKRPILPDLRDSGTLEQVADTIVFIYRDDYYDDASLTPGQVELHIAKQRHGRAGGRPMVGWVANVTKFVDIQTQHINLEGF